MKLTTIVIIVFYSIFICGVSARKLQFKSESKEFNRTEMNDGTRFKTKFIMNDLLVLRLYFPYEYGSLIGKQVKANDKVKLQKHMVGFSFLGSLEDVSFTGIHTALLGESTHNSTVNGCSIALVSHLKRISGIGVNILSAKNDTSNGLFLGLRNYGRRVHGISFNLLGADNEDVAGVTCSSWLSEIKKLNGVTANVLGSDIEDCNGVGLSLFINKHVASKGMMIAGFINDAEDISGVQLALGNKAQLLQGLQCGIVNMIGDDKQTLNVQFGIVNKTKGRNIQIGLLNFSKNGFLPFCPFFNF